MLNFGKYLKGKGWILKIIFKKGGSTIGLQETRWSKLKIKNSLSMSNLISRKKKVQLDNNFDIRYFFGKDAKKVAEELFCLNEKLSIKVVNHVLKWWPDVQFIDHKKRHQEKFQNGFSRHEIAN